MGIEREIFLRGLPIPNPMIDASLVQKIADLAVKGEELRQIEVDGVKFLVPFGNPSQLVSLAPHMAHPARKRAQIAISEPESLIAYVQAHKLPETAIFATRDEKGAAFTAVIDYHEKEFAPGGESANNVLANWGQHRAVLTSAYSPEWKRWLDKDKALMTQPEFAEFLEDNAQDIVVPDADQKAPNAAQMLEVALTLQAKSGVNFSSAIRLSNGEQKLAYDETIESKAGQSGNLTIPGHFYLSLPPFIGTPRYLVKAKLRFRLGRGAVMFFFEIDRPHKIIEAAIDDIKEKVTKATGIPVFMGLVQSIG